MVFILGLAFGSFANVCIYRLPRGESIIRPPSHCPNCNREVKWYDNIPLVSYILLSGKCRYCKKEISPQYPLVELITGTLFLFTAVKFYPQIPTVVAFFALVVYLVIISSIDMKSYMIPDALTYSLVLLGLICAPFNSLLMNSGAKFLAEYRGVSLLVISLEGVIAGGGLLYLVGALGKLIFKREAMGGGDIKLISGVGAFVGPVNVLWVLLVSSILGAVTGLGLVVSGRYRKFHIIPFGVYISLATVLVYLLQPGLGYFYLKLVSICQ